MIITDTLNYGLQLCHACTSKHPTHFTPYPLPALHPSQTIPPCGTLLYRVNRYVTVSTTVLLNMQLFLYATDRPIAMLFSLFLLQGVF